jgi:glycolate oxidase iron-sulfur subunit
VHCGFCLPTCPTYLLWGEEMDSPRGRIYLMKAGIEGRIETSASFVGC